MYDPAVVTTYAMEDSRRAAAGTTAGAAGHGVSGAGGACLMLSPFLLGYLSSSRCGLPCTHPNGPPMDAKL